MSCSGIFVAKWVLIMCKSLKIVYFGSSGDLSLQPFRALMASIHEVVAVVIVKKPLKTSDINLIPLDASDSIESLAVMNKIQILNLGDNLAALESEISFLSPDLIVTSCFAKRIPEAILALPKMASINIHPSLLPLYRGPDPIFWQVRDGVSRTGVSMHVMTNHFDTGDIIAQQNIDIEVSLHIVERKKILAKLGSRLLIKALKNIERSINLAYKQTKNKASYQSFPELKDFALIKDWDAERIYQFMKATEGLTPFYPLLIEGKSLRLTKVIDFNAQEKVELSFDQNKVKFPCKKGSVVAEFLTPCFDRPMDNT